MTGFPFLFAWAQPIYDGALNVFGVVSDAAGKLVIGALTPIIETTQAHLAGLNTFVTERIPEGIGAVADFYTDAAGNFQAAIAPQIIAFQNGVATNLVDLEVRLGQGWEGAQLWVQDAGQNIFNVIDPLVQNIQTGFLAGLDGLAAGVNTVLGDLGEGLLGGFQLILDNVIAPFQEIIIGIPTAIGAGIAGAGQGIIEGIAGIPQFLINGIGAIANNETLQQIQGFMGNFLNSIMEGTASIVEDFIHPLLTPVGSPPEDVIADVIGIVAKLGLGAATLALPFIAGELVHPLKELGLGQVSAFIFDMAGFSKYAGSISSTIAERTIAAPLRYALNWLVHPYKPRIADYDWMWWRGHIDEQGYRALIQFDGLDLQYHDAFVDHAWKIPGATDLVRFAVREVFDPDPAINLEVMRGWIQKQGLKGVWADAYWAAHWELPSVSQVYNMEARGIPTPMDLDAFLRVKDVMPEWRQPLLDIRYNLLQRVDLRYAWKSGVISTDDLVRRLRATGLSPDDAVTSANTQIRRAMEGDISALRSEIEGDYKEGLITGDQARANFVALGYASDFVDIRMVALGRRRERDLILDTIRDRIDAYVKNQIETEAELNNILGQMLVDQDRINQLIEHANIRKVGKVAS